MSSISKRQVLSTFKSLHRTCKKLFEGDARGIEASRKKVNEEYKKNKLEADVEKIKELLQASKEAENYLKTSFVQLKYNENKKLYEMNITKDTALITNIPYKHTD